MPFSMTHLYISYNILKNTTQIKKPCEFLLGALAPDSVHFRENYESDMKKKSHLCVGDAKWGRATNNKEWMENVLSFLKENEHTEKADFIYGYCSHILADIQNNIRIWTPFRVENEEALEKGLGSAYHEESIGIDYALYELNSNKEEMWKMLEEAVGYELPNVIGLNEINKMKHSILHNQYINKECLDLSGNKYVTLSGMQDFIDEESQYIGEILFS